MADRRLDAFNAPDLARLGDMISSGQDFDMARNPGNMGPARLGNAEMPYYGAGTPVASRGGAVNAIGGAIRMPPVEEFPASSFPQPNQFMGQGRAPVPRNPSFDDKMLEFKRRNPASAGPNRGPNGAGVRLPGGVSMDSVYNPPDVAGPMSGAGGGGTRDLHGAPIGPELTPGGRVGMAVRGATLPLLGEALSGYNNMQAVRNPRTLGDKFIQDAYQNPSLRGGAGLGQFIGEALNTVGGPMQTMREIAHAGAPAMSQASRAFDRGRPLEAAVDVGRAAYDVGRSALVDHGAKPLLGALAGVGDQIYNAFNPQPAGPPMSAAPIALDGQGNFSRAPTNQAEYDQMMAMKYGPNRQQAGAEGSADSPFPAQDRPRGNRGMAAPTRPRESAESYANRAQAEIDRRRPEREATNREAAERYALFHPKEQGQDKILSNMGHLLQGTGSLEHSRAQARELPRQTDISLRNAMANELNAKRPQKVDPLKAEQARMERHLNDLYQQDEARLGVDAAQALYAKRRKAAFGTRETQTRDNTLEDRMDQIEVK